MKSNTLWLTVVALLAVVGVGLAWRMNESTSRAVAAAKKVNAQVAADLRRVAARGAAATRRWAEIQAELESLQTPPRSPIPPPTPAPARDAAPQPAAVTKQLGGRLLLKYGSFHRALGLTAEQVARFEQEFAAHDARRNEIGLTARNMRGDFIPGERPPPLPPTIVAQYQAENERHQAGLAALLGVEGFEAFQEFERSEPRRRVVAELVGDFALTSTPLSSVQARQLRQVLDEVNYGFAGDPEARNSATRNWETILARATGFLTTAQVAALQRQADRSRPDPAMEEMKRLVAQTKK